MNFQLKETALKPNKFSPKGVGYKLFGERASYFNMENKEEIWKDIIGFVEIIIGTVDYIVERHKLRKINNHRKKCGLLKVEKDVSKN